ncbi:M61 family metallopeptidase [Algoriphagus sp. PAP.12]|uniref:M61 family metallopeptidase n=1 Tax=Algoriphagus sp. PAP.12 TaxID=2996678 RepID=UPI00227C1A4F|nr:M61 family peptidase [Algoriphagus sp. PAP.12]
MNYQNKFQLQGLFAFLFLFLTSISLYAQTELSYTISFPDPSSGAYQVEMEIGGLSESDLTLQMPRWMPGYYQLMDYGKNIRNLKALSLEGDELLVVQKDFSTWGISGIGSKSVIVTYQIQTTRKFVATSFVDQEHAYIVPTNSWLYPNGRLDLSPKVKVNLPNAWEDVATGLKVEGDLTFSAVDMDVLFDSPLLIGNLEELPSFEVAGVKHRFLAHQIGEFDKQDFINRLKNSLEESVELMGDIPFDEYTFISIGPGRGGIEHLNNTTFSLDGNQLQTEGAVNGAIAFLTHEYYHHYNAKRIRPVELGPFDYQKANRTTQLWVSEGLTVYYEYILMRRSGVINDEQFLSYFADLITRYENDEGKNFQSLEESSYRTWDEGPFGQQGTTQDTTITYYEKGPVVGLLIDFAIRNASNNQQSLDDVMRFMYNHYYKDLGRGFTDAEIREACETAAGMPLGELFDYLQTTKPLDYQKYLLMAGLELEKSIGDGKDRFTIVRSSDTNEKQSKIYKEWTEGNVH